MKKTIFFIIVCIFVTLIFLFSFFLKKEESIKPTFKGPQGAPFIKGPFGPPPSLDSTNTIQQ
ncbi:hypothetical protein C4565_01075 [Candidatus Parcubacteria bacterium]|jgi:hypothetical protein|nr:MAG: hypothetical protein C4565_01075 [Candidatus Parcubacteria bacterium]